jgi:ATP-dependent exoDNAse (exonuclease V) alpha subunit
LREEFASTPRTGTRKLNAGQRQAVDEVFLSREKIVGLDGVAGAGKTTTLAVVREGAEQAGYKVEGFAPTSRAAQKLGEAGIETKTLQAHLAQGQRADTGEHRLYVMDESSLASTKQMHEFVSRLHPNDRVLLVGDTRQHESVEAGRIFAQLQDAGMKTVKLEEIVRQRDPELKQTVEQLARGEVGEAIAGLERQGRIHEVPGHEDRIAAIAKEYAKSPDNTLVVSPDNRSRAEINQAIHAELQAKGVVGREEHRAQVLVPRQDLTGADRMWAARYNPGDVLRYSAAPKRPASAKASMRGLKASMRPTTGSPSSGRTARSELRSTAPAGRFRLPRTGAGLLSGRPCAAHRARARLEAGQPRAGDRRGHRPGWADEFEDGRRP